VRDLQALPVLVWVEERPECYNIHGPQRHASEQHSMPAPRLPNPRISRRSRRKPRANCDPIARAITSATPTTRPCPPHILFSSRSKIVRRGRFAQ
jgi:hypothetical protein